jgi:glycerate kinase
MRFLLIPDKFKGSLSAEEVIRTLAKGIHMAIPNADCIKVLASDGGDGFLEAVARYQDCRRITYNGRDPLGRNHSSDYLFNEKSKEAFIELAAASGLVLLEKGERNALYTSTYGTGLQLKDAIERGASKVNIGLGGSATNDGGIGIAVALGYRFFDSGGGELKPTGDNLLHIAEISAEQVSADLGKVSITAINDVNNPLYGPNGAACIYAEQKGASPHEIRRLDRGLKHLDQIVQKTFKKDLSRVAGTGAAGGAAYGLKVFCGAEFLSGIEFILQMAGTSAFLAENDIDYIITGEGKIDRQTLSGKLIQGVVQLGKKHKVPVIAVCGKLDVPPGVLKTEGLHDIIEVGDPDMPLEYNMAHAANLLQAAVTKYFK